MRETETVKQKHKSIESETKRERAQRTAYVLYRRELEMSLSLKLMLYTLVRFVVE